MSAQRTSWQEGRAEWWLPRVIAILALIAFAVLIGVMLDNVGDTETKWARAYLVFGAAEAIVFAAAGFFFGREVNRERAQAAEQTAEQAQENRASAEKVAAEKSAKITVQTGVINKVTGEMPELERLISSLEQKLRSALPSVPGNDSYAALVSSDPSGILARINAMKIGGTRSGDPADQQRSAESLEGLDLRLADINLRELTEARAKVERMRGILEAAPE